MSRNLDQLYQEMILEHNRNPKNFGELNNATHIAHGKNPLCGDDFIVYLTIKNNKINDIRFHGNGCAISKSSGSLMTSILKDKMINEAIDIKNIFLELVTDSIQSTDNLKKIGKLKIFEGVKKYPIRVKCATLTWRAVEAAINNPVGNESLVSTE